MARVDIDYNYAEILRLTTKVSFFTARKGAEAAQRHARRLAPFDTGALRMSIKVRLKGTVGQVTTFTIYSDLDYAQYQEFGTGPITPRTAKVLSFKVGGKRVFAMRTRGVPATHFMSRAGALITARDFT